MFFVHFSSFSVDRRVEHLGKKLYLRMLGRIAVKNKFYSELSSLVGSSSIKDNIPVVICDSDDLDSRNWVFEKLLKLLSENSLIIPHYFLSIILSSIIS